MRKYEEKLLESLSGGKNSPVGVGITRENLRLSSLRKATHVALEEL